MENVAGISGLASAESSDQTSSMKDAVATVMGCSTELHRSNSEQSVENPSIQSSLPSPSSPSKLEDVPGIAGGLSALTVKTAKVTTTDKRSSTQPSLLEDGSDSAAPHALPSSLPPVFPNHQPSNFDRARSASQRRESVKAVFDSVPFTPSQGVRAPSPVASNGESPPAGFVPPIYGYQPQGYYGAGMAGQDPVMAANHMAFTPFMGYGPPSLSIHEPPSPLMGSPVGTPTAMMFPQTPFAGAHNLAHYASGNMAAYAANGNPFASDMNSLSPQHSSGNVANPYNYYHPIFNNYLPAVLSPYNHPQPALSRGNSTSYSRKGSYSGHANGNGMSRMSGNGSLRQQQLEVQNYPPYQEFMHFNDPVFSPGHSRTSSRSWNRMSGIFEVMDADPALQSSKPRKSDSTESSGLHPAAAAAQQAPASLDTRNLSEGKKGTPAALADAPIPPHNTQESFGGSHAYPTSMLNHLMPQNQLESMGYIMAPYAMPFMAGALPMFDPGYSYQYQMLYLPQPQQMMQQQQQQASRPLRAGNMYSPPQQRGPSNFEFPDLSARSARMNQYGGSGASSKMHYQGPHSAMNGQNAPGPGRASDQPPLHSSIASPDVLMNQMAALSAGSNNGPPINRTGGSAAMSAAVTRSNFKRRNAAEVKMGPDGQPQLNARQRRTLRRAQERALKGLIEASKPLLMQSMNGHISESQQDTEGGESGSEDGNGSQSSRQHHHQQVVDQDRTDLYLGAALSVATGSAGPKAAAAAVEALSKAAADLHSMDLNHLLPARENVKDGGLLDDKLLRDLKIIQNLLGAIKLQSPPNKTSSPQSASSAANNSNRSHSPVGSSSIATGLSAFTSRSELPSALNPITANMQVAKVLSAASATGHVPLSSPTGGPNVATSPANTSSARMAVAAAAAMVHLPPELQDLGRKMRAIMEGGAEHGGADTLSMLVLGMQQQQQQQQVFLASQASPGTSVTVSLGSSEGGSPLASTGNHSGGGGGSRGGRVVSEAVC